MNDERIRDRIRKILALANDAGATSDESANAMEMAMRLMAQAGVTSEELKATAVNDTEGELVHADVDSAAYKWQVILAGAAADLYGAFVTIQRKFYNGSWTKVINFHGSDDVVDAAQQTYRWFWKQIRASYKEYLKASGKNASMATRQAFQVSAALEVRRRVRKLLDTTTIERGNGTALVVVEHTKSIAKRNQERFEEELGHTIKAGRSTKLSVGDWAAYGAGNQAGANVQLQTTIEAKARGNFKANRREVMANHYRMLYRPAYSAALPPGLKWEYVEAPPNIAHRRLDIPCSWYQFGVFKTDRPLTEYELEAYQIVPVGEV